MKDMTSTLPPQKKEDGVVISYHRYVPIQSSTTPYSPPSNTDNTLDSIGYSSFSTSQPSFTKNSKQTVLASTLKTFLYWDLTSSLPEFGKWVGWSSDRRYTGSRISQSDNHLHLLCSTEKGDLDVFELPYSRGGFRKPILRKTFSAVQVGILQEMLACKNVSGGLHYCGYCPSCLRFQSGRKVFVNKSAEIRRLESEIGELKELSEKGQKVISSTEKQIVKEEKRGFKGSVRRLKRRLDRLESWKNDPSRHLLYREDRIRRLQASGKKVNDSSKLIQLPHWMLSISCPTPLHAVYSAQDAWLTGRVSGQGTRRPESVQRILTHLEGKGGGFTEIMRRVFRSLVLEAVQAQHPGIELTMEHQMHPFNKFDDAPDVHFLVCQKTLDEEGRAVDVSFDTASLRQEVEARMRCFADFVEWAVKRWNGGCRATEFKRWRKEVLAGIKEIRAEGIPCESVAVSLVPVPELLDTHCYIRRQPMENVKNLFVDNETGRVTVRYYRAGTADFGVVDLLWRLVGFDGRSLGVQYGGAYRSTRGLKRDRKVDALYEALREDGIEHGDWTLERTVQRIHSPSERPE